ncbi:hypothetical protein PoB_002697600 [Plakobranchus ocellatus]|uniref:Uncharacterized protein n=1 Tax=Plakobranchus ocellatus TaxID=259542 RepID=A0AAV3ZX11_9GAST|nr:hypothetical protein PoB_002697600 [Plakobranchus ocellatus]
MVISGFQALRQARTPVVRLEPTTDGSLQISRRIRSPLYHRPPISEPSSTPSGQDAGGEARTHDRRIPADFKADSLATVPPTPNLRIELYESISGSLTLRRDAYFRSLEGKSYI